MDVEKMSGVYVEGSWDDYGFVKMVGLEFVRYMMELMKDF